MFKVYAAGNYHGKSISMTAQMYDLVWYHNELWC